MSFIDGMIGNYIRGLSPDQRKQMLRSASEQVLQNTTPQEREEILKEAFALLLGSLTAEQRERLGRQFAESLSR